MHTTLTKISAAVRFIGKSFLLSLLFWLIMIYVIINDGALQTFRYMGF